ncbi:MAG: protein kinase domain-containing protein [Gemmatimonadaceae bacterium]
MSGDRWTVMQRVFEGALLLHGDDRQRYLDDACGNDAALRREIDALLAADEEGSSFLDGIAGDGLSSRDEDLAPGTAVGAWRIMRRLAEGGMGLVYLAKRADGAFEQEVALKVIKRGMDSREIVARFRSERQILARLQHPNIARLVDGGVTDDSRPWFAMEYVDGKPIDVYCDEHHLTVAQRLDLFIEVCAAVQFAHANLVVHRDLKPDNILVTSTGDVKLLDFGIGKVLEADNTKSQLTKTGTRLNTPAYASPEQLRGQPVSTATDIYSLGVVLFELLVGQRPVRGWRDAEPPPPDAVPESPLAALRRSRQQSGADSLDSVCTTRDTRLDRLERQLRGDLEVICGSALQVETERRYASVEALANDVRRHRDGLPVLARPDSLAYRARKFVARNRTGVIAATIVLLLVSSTVAFYTVRLRTERTLANHAATRANDVSNFLVNIFKRASPQSPEQLTTARQLLDDAVSGIDTLAKDQPALYSNVLMTTGMVYREMGDMKAAEPQLRKLVAVNRSIFDKPAVLSIQAKSQLATTLEDEGKFAQAEPFFESALAEARALPDDPYAVAYCLNNLARLLVDMARYAEAEPPLREVVAIYGRPVALPAKGAAPAASPFAASAPWFHTEWRATALRNLGRTVRLEGRLSEADSIFRLSVIDSRAAGPTGTPQVAETLYEDAALQIDLGRLDSARTLALASLAMRHAKFLKGHPTIGQSFVQLASIARRQGRLRAADSLLTRGDSILRAMLPGTHAWIATAELERAELLRAQNRPAAAEYESALAGLRAALGADHPDYAETLVRYGNYVAEQQGCGRAAPLLARGLGVLAARLGATNPRVARDRTLAGRCAVQFARGPM